MLEVAGKDRFKESETAVRDIESVVSELVIDSKDMAEIGAAMIRQLKETRTSVTEARLSITRPMDEAKKRAMALFNPLVEKCDELEKSVRDKLTTYMLAERARADAENERRRLEAENVAAELASQADAAAEAGDASEAAALAAIAEISRSAVSTVTASAPKGAGIRSLWKHEIKDFRALVHAAAADDTLLPLLMPNDTEIGQRARSLKSAMVVPGIRVWDAGSLTVR